MYPTLIGNADYTAVINARQKARLEGYLSEAAEKGAKVVRLNPANESFEGSKKLEPTLVLGGTDEMAVLSEEIFGPILPILPYDTLDDAIAYVNDRPRPLALYVFDHDEEAVEKVLSETTSGGVTVNDTMLHIAQDDMPFGGVGPSGMGHYHGKEGLRRAHQEEARLLPGAPQRLGSHAPSLREGDRLLPQVRLGQVSGKASRA
jgi:coniferyl-aldehyde dehydrogenase